MKSYICTSYYTCLNIFMKYGLFLDFQTWIFWLQNPSTNSETTNPNFFSTKFVDLVKVVFRIYIVYTYCKRILKYFHLLKLELALKTTKWKNTHKNVLCFKIPSFKSGYWILWAIFQRSSKNFDFKKGFCPIVTCFGTVAWTWLRVTKMRQIKIVADVFIVLFCSLDYVAFVCFQ